MADTSTPKLGLTKPGVADPGGINAWGPKLNANFDILDNAFTTAAAALAAIKTVDGSGSGLDADLLDGNDAAYYLAWANFTGTPASFPPTLPIPSSGVTGLDAAQAAQDSAIALKANIASPTFTGDPKAPTPATADNDTSIATTAFVKAQGYISPDAPNDGTQYVRQSAGWAPVSVPPGTAISDTPPASPQPGQMWWESDTGNLYIWFNDGTSSQWVQVAGGPTIADAPADGNEYVRVNGVWRLKSQVLNLSSTGVNVVVPVGAKHAKIEGRVLGATTGLNPVIRASIDGSTYLAGASDYIYAGSILYTGSSGSPTKVGAIATSYYYLTMGAYTDQTGTALHFDVDLVVGKVSGMGFGFRARMAAYHSASTAGFQEVFTQGYSNWTNHSVQTQIAAFQIILTGGTFQPYPASHLTVTWGY
jgi:hypothetical protein